MVVTNVTLSYEVKLQTFIYNYSEQTLSWSSCQLLLLIYQYTRADRRVYNHFEYRISRPIRRTVIFR